MKTDELPMPGLPPPSDLSRHPAAVYQRNKYREDPEFRRRKAERAKTPAAKAKAKAKRAEKFRANPTLHRWLWFEKALKRNHGLTVEEYARLEYAQSRRCKVCRDPLDTTIATRNVHVDHDHLTKKIRGLTCSPCNTAIGCCRENPDIARRIAAYIEAHW